MNHLASHIKTPITITVEEALKLTGIGQTFFYELLADGSVASYKLGKRRLVDYASLRNFITSQPTGQLTAKQ
ncbi:MAG: excisionase family DNA-binding protein [Acidobacteriaceae bacterium]|nr:excisionase family DNA-binding protein [Acidobacteriaceae bacterium]